MKFNLFTINYQLYPLKKIKNEQSQAFEKVNDRIEALEKNFTELKDIVMKRTYQSFKMDPKLLEQWNSTMLVIRLKSLDKYEINSQQSCIRQHSRPVSQ